jgi:hypothetical protein
MPAVSPMRGPGRAEYGLGMTSTRRGRSTIPAWRINGLATSLILLIEFGLGAGLNLYVSVPTHKAFFSTVFGEWALALHAITALALIAAALSTLIRSARAGRAIFWSVLGLVAILVATGAGAGFVKNGSATASMAMAIAGIVALLSYVMVIFAV